MLIETQSELDNYLQLISKDKFIAVDTEFVRDKAYYPKLALIQICGAKAAFAIDVLKDLNLNQLCEIFENEKIVKIFHDCKQDLEILYYRFKINFKNIFDTQIAALFLGFHEGPGYTKLISYYLKIDIDKQLQYSNWLKRPLSDKHLMYALNDVELLYKIYTLMLTELKTQKKYIWAIEEFEKLISCRKFLNKESDQLTKLLFYARNKSDLKELLKLVRIREGIAQSINLNRNFVVSNDLLGVAIRNSKMKKTLFKKFEKFSNKIVLEHEDELLKKNDNELVDKTFKLKKLTKLLKNELYFELIKLLKTISEKYKISPLLIANNNDILKLSIKKFENNKTLQGWRNKIFGKESVKLVKFHDNLKNATQN